MLGRVGGAGTIWTSWNETQNTIKGMASQRIFSLGTGRSMGEKGTDSSGIIPS